jgi:hypothetical protein
MAGGRFRFEDIGQGVGFETAGKVLKENTLGFEDILKQELAPVSILQEVQKLNIKPKEKKEDPFAPNVDVKAVEDAVSTPEFQQRIRGLSPEAQEEEVLKEIEALEKAAGVKLSQASGTARDPASEEDAILNEQEAEAKVAGEQNKLEKRQRINFADLLSQNNIASKLEADLIKAKANTEFIINQKVVDGIVDSVQQGKQFQFKKDENRKEAFLRIALAKIANQGKSGKGPSETLLRADLKSIEKHEAFIQQKQKDFKTLGVSDPTRALRNDPEMRQKTEALIDSLSSGTAKKKARQKFRQFLPQVPSSGAKGASLSSQGTVLKTVNWMLQPANRAVIQGLGQDELLRFISKKLENSPTGATADMVDQIKNQFNKALGRSVLGL